MNIAVFPGSFDPLTKGHESIVRRALPVFDEIVIAIGYNTNKNYFFRRTGASISSGKLSPARKKLKSPATAALR